MWYARIRRMFQCNRYINTFLRFKLYLKSLFDLILNHFILMLSKKCREIVKLKIQRTAGNSGISFAALNWIWICIYTLAGMWMWSGERRSAFVFGFYDHGLRASLGYISSWVCSIVYIWSFRVASQCKLLQCFVN